MAALSVDECQSVDLAHFFVAMLVQPPSGSRCVTRSCRLLGVLMSVSTSLNRQLKDYRLTTAEILYRLPDHPAVLQSYIWQELDIAPAYPVLKRFLEFWEREIEGRVPLGG